MFLKVRDFLKLNEAALSVVPVILPIIDDLNLLLDALFTEAGLASDDIEGFTDEKKAARTTLISNMQVVSRALFAWWLVSGIEETLRMNHYKERVLLRYPDSTLHMRAEQLHKAADPVKALLTPYNCTIADVDALPVNRQQFLTVVEKPRTQRMARSQAYHRMLQIVEQVRALLKKLDIYLTTFDVPQPSLFHQYRSARSIDNLRGKLKKKPEPPAEG